MIATALRGSKWNAHLGPLGFNLSSFSACLYLASLDALATATGQVFPLKLWSHLRRDTIDVKGRKLDAADTLSMDSRGSVCDDETVAFPNWHWGLLWEDGEGRCVRSGTALWSSLGLFTFLFERQPRDRHAVGTEECPKATGEARKFHPARNERRGSRFRSTCMTRGNPLLGMRPDHPYQNIEAWGFGD